MNNKNNNKKQSETPDIISLVKKLLAEHIGVEPDDINNDDLLSEDLHMSSTDIADFINELTKSGLDTKDINLTEIEAVEDILEALSNLDLTS